MSLGVGHPSTCHQQDGIGEDEDYVKISDYRVWTKTAKNEKMIYKEISVSELSDRFYYIFFIIISFFKFIRHSSFSEPPL